ncbi:TPA: hypothetical protein O3J34_004290 [Salmonella enterica subsp. enterica serovar Saintpaul str. CFSAN004154]|nr:hypothetical protein [Salmonella enterica subsp. enterica serovar Saintpaul str. CFSAN004154]
MKKFTKDQLIARINQVTAINKYRISQDPDADGLVMDNELFAIAQTALTAEPVVPDLKELDAILNWILMLPVPTPKATQMAKRLAGVMESCRDAMLQGKALELVGEVVAWNAPERQGIYRNVDFRWRIDINVAPGTKLYALKDADLMGGN